MGSVVKSVDVQSPAHKAGVRAGDTLLKIDGHEISDVLDYLYYSYDKKLVLELLSADGKMKKLRLSKKEGADAGLEFESYLMDNPRACCNRCVFCFVDQLPRGMRSTLYFKDDDARLSFLQGNYVTLTNLSEKEVQRIIDLKISPINVSVHSTDEELRSYLLGTKKGADGLRSLKRLAEAKITLNCQIVCCPGINDGENLMKTMRDLAEMFPSVQSVSIVPVGLTGHREGLENLRPFDKCGAEKLIADITAFSDECLEKFGTRMFFCADELYIAADMELPSDEFYEDYPQLENGVGMMRLLITEFESELQEPMLADGAEFSVATGVAAANYLTNLLYIANKECDIISGKVFGIRNEFFGETINVAGLVTGSDIISQLSGKNLGSRLLISRNMLRQGENVFLDDITVEELSEKLGVPVRVVEQDGGDLLHAFSGS